MTRSFLGSGVALNHVGDYKTMRDLHRITNPTTMLGMVDGIGDVGKIWDMQADLPNTQIIGRVWHALEGGYAQPPTGKGDTRPMVATPEDILGQQVELGHHGSWLHVMNEPSAYLEPWQVQLTVDWLVKFIRLAAPENCACVLANLADGHPAIINGMWPAIWRPFLFELAKYPKLMRLGLHFYGPDQVINVLVALNATCKDMGIRPPQVVGTEFGVDSTGQGDALNGYHSHDWPGEQFLGWEQGQIQGPLKPFIASGQLLGLDTFQWNVLWGPFSIAQDEGYQKAYKASAIKGDLDVTVSEALNPPVVIPPAVPNERYTVTTPGVFINSHTAASTSADVMGQIPNQSVVMMLEEQIVNTEVWRKVKFAAITGWISMQAGKVKMTLYTPATTTVPPVTTPPAGDPSTPAPTDPVPPQETLPPPATSSPTVDLKRWSFAFEMVGTDAQCLAVSEGLEMVITGLAWLGQASGTSMTFKPKELPMQ